MEKKLIEKDQVISNLKRELEAEIRKNLQNSNQYPTITVTNVESVEPQSPPQASSESEQTNLSSALENQSEISQFIDNMFSGENDLLKREKTERLILVITLFSTLLFKNSRPLLEKDGSLSKKFIPYVSKRYFIKNTLSFFL